MIGGGQKCRFTVTIGGETRTTFLGGYSAGSAGSSEANAGCVSALANTAATSCKYDCAYDGFGN